MGIFGSGRLKGGFWGDGSKNHRRREKIFRNTGILSHTHRAVQEIEFPTVKTKFENFSNFT